MGKHQKHNYGIDLLRFIAMFFVVVLHILGRGGTIENSTGINNHICWLIETLATCAVDCYAMISGYVGYTDEKKTYKSSRIVTIWIQIVFYNLIITGSHMLWNNSFDVEMFLKCFLPLTTNEYWYFSSYFILFFIIPFLNSFMCRLSKKQFLFLIITLLAVFSIFATAISPFSDPLHVEMGYSAKWLIVLYILGAWLKKYDIPNKIKKIYSIVILACLVIVTWGFRTLIVIYFGAYSYYSTWLISYISLTVVGMAIMYVCIFARVKIKKQKIINIINKLTPCIFGVYLLQENPILRDLVVTNKYTFVNSFSISMLLFSILGIAITQFGIGIMIEYIRIKIFDKCRIIENIQLVEQKIKNKR